MKPINKLVLAIAAAAALAVPSMPLAAQGAPSPISLNGDVKAVKTVTDADGKQRTELVEPNTIVPGDRLVFGTDYANKGADIVTNFVVVNPLPGAVRLAPDADPALALAFAVSVGGIEGPNRTLQYLLDEVDGISLRDRVAVRRQHGPKGGSTRDDCRGRN